jgi:hypothetical protein
VRKVCGVLCKAGSTTAGRIASRTAGETNLPLPGGREDVSTEEIVGCTPGLLLPSQAASAWTDQLNTEK